MARQGCKRTGMAFMGANVRDNSLDADAVALGVLVGVDAGLQHLVIAVRNACRENQSRMISASIHRSCAATKLQRRWDSSAV